MGGSFLLPNVEITSVDNVHKQGWVYSSEADYLIYYVPGDGLIYVIQFSAIRKNIEDWRLKYRERSASNVGYKTIGILVPLCEFERISVQILNV